MHPSPTAHVIATASEHRATGVTRIMTTKSDMATIVEMKRGGGQGGLCRVSGFCYIRKEKPAAEWGKAKGRRAQQAAQEAAATAAAHGRARWVSAMGGDEDMVTDPLAS